MARSPEDEKWKLYACVYTCMTEHGVLMCVTAGYLLSDVHIWGVLFCH